MEGEGEEEDLALKRKGDVARASRGFRGTWSGTRGISRDVEEREVDETRKEYREGC